MNTWHPQQPGRSDPHNHVALGVLIALAVVGAALALLTALDHRDSRDGSSLAAAVSELHDARIELQASAGELRTATATLQAAARTLERRATTVNILDVAPLPPPPPAPLVEAGAPDCTGDGHCTLSRLEFQRLLADPHPLLRPLRVIPSIRDGQPRGLKLFAIRSGSLPRALGFHNGDLLSAVNGHPLPDLEHALAAYSALRDASVLEFAILRDDQPLTLTLTIE